MTRTGRLLRRPAVIRVAERERIVGVIEIAARAVQPGAGNPSPPRSPGTDQTRWPHAPRQLFRPIGGATCVC